MSPMNSSGIKTAISTETVSDMMGEADLLCAFERSVHRRLALFDVACDVFDHDDGIVDDEASCEIVKAIKVKLFRLKPKAYMAPKVPTNDSSTATPGMIVAANVRRNTKMTAMRPARCTTPVRTPRPLPDARDSGRAIRQHCNLDDRWNRGFELRQQLLDVVDHIDDIGARLALNIDDNPRGTLFIHADCSAFSTPSTTWRHP